MNDTAKPVFLKSAIILVLSIAFGFIMRIVFNHYDLNLYERLASILAFVCILGLYLFGDIAYTIVKNARAALDKRDQEAANSRCNRERQKQQLEAESKSAAVDVSNERLENYDEAESKPAGTSDNAELNKALAQRRQIQAAPKSPPNLYARKPSDK